MATRLRQLTPGQIEELGQSCADLLQGESRWIFRRSESVTILDEATIRRQQSVDFSLDTIESMPAYKRICGRVFGREVCAAPLFILDKDPTASLSFDLEDESGRSLSLPTSEESGEVSAATLQVLARRKLERFDFLVPEALMTRLAHLARSDGAEGQVWLDRLENPLPGDPEVDAIECLLSERNDGGQMRWWIETLAFASIVIVAFEPGRNHRRVIKIAREQPVTNGRVLLPRLGWRSFKILLYTPLITAGRYQLDVQAPPELRLTQVALAQSREKRSLKTSGFRRRAQLYVDQVHDARGALARFGLRVSGRGVLAGALVAALLVFISIAACIRFNEEIAKGSGSAAPLLLLLPGIIATYVTVRGDQHELAVRLLAVPRWILLCAGVAAYYSAGAIALIGKVEKARPAQTGPKGAAEAALAQVHYDASVARHAEQIQQWLGPAALVAAAVTAVIGIGWICNRQSLHRVGRLLGGTLRAATRIRFRLEVSLRASEDFVWEYIQQRILRLHEAGKLEETRSSAARRRCVIYRALGPINWTHGFEVNPAAPGARVSWVFKADSPLWLRPAIVPFVLFERAMAHLRIAAFKWKYAV